MREGHGGRHGTARGTGRDEGNGGKKRKGKGWRWRMKEGDEEGEWGKGMEEMDGEEGWSEREVVRCLRRMEAGNEGGRRRRRMDMAGGLREKDK